MEHKKTTVVQWFFYELWLITFPFPKGLLLNQIF